MTKMAILDPIRQKRIEITNEQDRRAKQRAIEKNIWYHNALRQVLEEEAFKKYEENEQ